MMWNQYINWSPDLIMSQRYVRLCLSNSNIFASTSSPTYELSSLTLLTSINDAGRNPLTPISTIRPPLTDSITVPFTDLF